MVKKQSSIHQQMHVPQHECNVLALKSYNRFLAACCNNRFTKLFQIVWLFIRWHIPDFVSNSPKEKIAYCYNIPNVGPTCGDVRMGLYTTRRKILIKLGTAMTCMVMRITYSSIFMLFSLKVCPNINSVKTKVT